MSVASSAHGFCCVSSLIAEICNYAEEGFSYPAHPVMPAAMMAQSGRVSEQTEAAALAAVASSATQAMVPIFC